MRQNVKSLSLIHISVQPLRGVYLCLKENLSVTFGDTSPGMGGKLQGLFKAPECIGVAHHAAQAAGKALGALLEPVSYTHLDVYKRQVKDFRQWIALISISCYSILVGIVGYALDLNHSLRCILKIFHRFLSIRKKNMFEALLTNRTVSVLWEALPRILTAGLTMEDIVATDAQFAVCYFDCLLYTSLNCHGKYPPKMFVPRLGFD